MTMHSSAQPPVRNPLSSVRRWFQRTPSERQVRDPQASGDSNPLMAFEAEGSGGATAPEPTPAPRDVDHRDHRELHMPRPAVAAGILAAAALGASAVLVYARWDQLQAAERHQGKL